MARLGTTNQAAVDLVVKRSSEENLPQLQAMLVLELYAIPAQAEISRRRLRFLMSTSEVAARYRDECGNLFADLKPGDKESEGMIRRGAVHAEEFVRAAAIAVLDKLPRQEARGFLRKSLADPSGAVRRSAIRHVVTLCTKDDSAWLGEIAKQESNENYRNWLAKLISELSMCPP